MEILIFSDSHGRVDTMRCAVAEHARARYLLFCGDGLRDFAQIADENRDKICIAVRGNCDIYDPLEDTPYERLLEIGGIKIFMLHGHSMGIKGGYGAACIEARRAGADILLCGHTHLPYEHREAEGDAPIVIFNPGSIGKREAEGYSYGVLTIQDRQFLLSHGKI